MTPYGSPCEDRRIVPAYDPPGKLRSTPWCTRAVYDPVGRFPANFTTASSTNGIVFRQAGHHATGRRRPVRPETYDQTGNLFGCQCGKQAGFLTEPVEGLRRQIGAKDGVNSARHIYFAALACFYKP